MGYTKEAIKGMSWTWGLRMFTRIISFARVAIIARLLTPAQFGLYGIAALVLSFVEVITETGINIFIIQENEDLEDIVSTAWIVSMVRGIVIFLIIVAFAPVISLFFRSPDSSRLVFLIALVPLIKGFINPAIVKFQKELMFGKEFYFRGFLFFVESLAGVVFVFLYNDPAGLIYGLILGAIVEVIISFMFIKPIPSLAFDGIKGRRIISRGKWLTLSGIFNYLYHNADDAVVGRVLGTSSLGIYDMAYRISMLPITEIGQVVSKVILPIYVKISGDIFRLKKAFIKTSFMVFIVTLPVGIIFFIFAEQIVLIVLGETWISAVPVFRVLSIFGVIRTGLNPAYSLFLAIKKQEYNTVITLLSFGVMITTIIPLINKFGLVGAGYSVIFGSMIAVFPTIFYLRKIFK